MSGNFRKIDPQSVDFSESPTFRKTAKLNDSDIEICTGEQEIVTIIDGLEETRNTAKEGDRIVTGPKGERYVIAGDKFEKLYEANPDNVEEFRAKGTIHATHVTENISFTAPWGEEMYIKAGGVLVQNGDDIYGIEEDAFAQTYGRADREGNVFAALDESTISQRAKAAELGESNHLSDIENRKSFNNYRERENDTLEQSITHER